MYYDTHPEAFVQNFFQVTDIIFLLARNKSPCDAGSPNPNRSLEPDGIAPDL